MVEYAIKKNNTLKWFFFWKKVQKFLLEKNNGKLHFFWTQGTTEYIDEEIKMTENRKTSKVFVAVAQSTHSQVIIGEIPLKGYVLASYAFWRTGQHLIHVWVLGSSLGFDNLPLIRKNSLKYLLRVERTSASKLRHCKGQQLRENDLILTKELLTKYR